MNVRVKVGKESEYWEVESTSKGVRELVCNAIAKKAGNCQLKKLRTKHPNIWLTSTHLRIKGSSISPRVDSKSEWKVLSCNVKEKRKEKMLAAYIHSIRCHPSCIKPGHSTAQSLCKHHADL